jgi:hypothetical protein
VCVYKREAYQSHMQIPFAVAPVGGRPTAPAPKSIYAINPRRGWATGDKRNQIYSLCTPADMFKIDHESLSYSTKTEKSCDFWRRKVGQPSDCMNGIDINIFIHKHVNLFNTN